MDIVPEAGPRREANVQTFAHSPCLECSSVWEYRGLGGVLAFFQGPEMMGVEG